MFMNMRSDKDQDKFTIVSNSLTLSQWLEIVIR